MGNDEIRQWEMRDPALVLERRQELARKRSCAGCEQIKVVTDPFGNRRLQCRLGKEVGQRCWNYKERGSE